MGYLQILQGTRFKGVEDEACLFSVITGQKSEIYVCIPSTRELRLRAGSKGMDPPGASNLGHHVPGDTGSRTGKCQRVLCPMECAVQALLLPQTKPQQKPGHVLRDLWF